ATRPIAAAEMALIRLAYAADLPPTDKLVRDLLESDGGDARPRASSPSAPSSSAPRSLSSGNTVTARAAPAPQAMAEAGPTLRTLEDVVALAGQRGAAVLKVHLESDVHLV